MSPLRQQIMRQHIERRVIACRTDPVFDLSDGQKFRVAAEVGLDRDTVQEVQWILHLPEGVSLVDVRYTGALKDRETTNVVNDSPEGQYSVDAQLVLVPLNWSITELVAEGDDPITEGAIDQPLSLVLGGRAPVTANAENRTLESYAQRTLARMRSRQFNLA